MPTFKAQIVIDATVGLTSEQVEELVTQLRDDADTDDLTMFGKYLLGVMNADGPDKAVEVLLRHSLRVIIRDNLLDVPDGSIRFKMAPPKVILTPKEPTNVSD